MSEGVFQRVSFTDTSAGAETIAVAAAVAKRKYVVKKIIVSVSDSATVDTSFQIKENSTILMNSIYFPSSPTVVNLDVELELTEGTALNFTIVTLAAGALSVYIEYEIRGR